MNLQSWEKDDWNVKKQRGRSHDQDSSEPLLLCSKGVGTTMDCHNRDHNLDILRVLKEIVNSSDYAAKTPQGITGRTAAGDLNLTNVKENESEKGHLESLANSRVKLLNESSKTRAVGGWHVLLRTESTLSNARISNNDKTPSNLEVPQETSMNGADGQGGVSWKERKAVEDSVFATQDMLTSTQTNLNESSGSDMLPPRVQGSGALRPPTAPKKNFRAHRKKNLVASGWKKYGSRENDHLARDPAHSTRRKPVLRAKPRKWRRLSTAFSVARRICHGGDAGVVDAQVRPLLIIAGKCVFRTSAPLDTPRMCTALDRRKIQLPSASNGDENGPSPTWSVDVSCEDTRKAWSYTGSTCKDSLPSQRISDRPSRSMNICQGTAPSIRPWPVVVPKLDVWISETIDEWLEKEDHEPAVANSSLSHPLVTIGSPVLSNTCDVRIEENQRVPGLLQVSTATEVPIKFLKSSPTLLTESRKPVTAPTKIVTELDARIRQAQTVHDLSQILEPISQVVISSVSGNVVTRGINTTPASILEEFGKDDVVQAFQRQIHVLEQQNEDLKSSLCKQEHSALLQRLETFRL